MYKLALSRKFISTATTIIHFIQQMIGWLTCPW